MRVTNTGNKNATLVEDREGYLRISMYGDLVLTRNDIAVEFDSESLKRNRIQLHGMHVWAISQKSRIARFFRCMKIVWSFCK